MWNGKVYRRVDGSWHETPVTVEAWRGWPSGEAPVRTADGTLWLRSARTFWQVRDSEAREVLGDLNLQTFLPAQGTDVVCTFTRADALWVALVSPDGRVRSLSRKDLGVETDTYHIGAFVHGDQVWLGIVQNVTEASILRIPLDRFRAVEPRAVA